MQFRGLTDGLCFADERSAVPGHEVNEVSCSCLSFCAASSKSFR